MTKQQVYELAKRAGHSAAKAAEIALDYDRGDPFVHLWVEAIEDIKWKFNETPQHG